MSGGPRYRHFLRGAAIMALLALGILAGLNVVIWRVNPTIDLTSNHRHSVSPGTLKALDSLAWPISAKFYISRERPPFTAGLKREVIAKLTAISSGSNAKFLFDPAADVVDVEATSSATGEMAKFGIKSFTTTTPTGTTAYFASLRIESVALREPVVIPIESTERMEYDLATQAVRARLGRAEPPTIEAKLAAIGEGLSITYVCGSKVEGFGDDGKLPQAWAHLPDEAEAIFARIRSANPSVITKVDHHPASPLRVGLPINGVIYSHFVLDFGGRRTTRIDQVTTMEGMFNLLAKSAWDLTLPRRKVGIFQGGAEHPSMRKELIRVEARRFYLSWSPEHRLQKLLEQLGHETIPVTASHEVGIPTEIEALIVPRPSNLSPIELYEIQSYLAAGGNVLLFHGEWHMPLVDQGLAVNTEAQIVGELFFANEPTGLLSLQHISGTMSEYLASLGVQTAAGIIVADGDAMPTRVLGPTRRSGSLHTAEPSIFPARDGLVPIASGLNPPHPLVRDVTSLALRTTSPLQLDQSRIAESKLTATNLLVTPPGTKLLPIDADRSPAAIQYSSGSGSEWLPPMFNQQKPEPALVSADGLPVAVLLTGEFPFDPFATPPMPPEGGRSLKAPGDRFVKAPGRMVIVASPDGLEHIDMEGPDIAGLPRAGPLLGDTFRASEVAFRRLLANVVDTFVYGDELIEVRKSLLPTPRRVMPWSNDERMFWLAANLALVPIIGILVWLMRVLNRRASQRS